MFDRLNIINVFLQTTQVTTPRKKKRVGNTASPVLSDREESELLHTS